MRQDILIDESGVPIVTNGDFTIGESDAQHIELLLKTSPNEWKANSIVGIAIRKALSGNLNGVIKRNIRVQLEADGYKEKTITENENGINVIATTI
ncbi:hypothetical protein ACFOWM_06310 [Ferruginibacter yonginensis]|uniref:Uncharacterized protein n=1 Tax=Ferruginibacter yonginensis TaxID=1310416 RepID=A0ABV8QS55_9BACT